MPERRPRSDPWFGAPPWLVLLCAGLLALVVAEHMALRRYVRLGLVYWHGDPRRRAIALTFDDGPNPPYTGEILEVLRRRGVKATFFIVGGNARDHPEEVRAVREGGHALGNHSYSHDDLLLERESRVLSQIERTQEAIRAAAGVCPALFRAPFGFEDAFVFRAARKAGLAVVKWSDSSRDWTEPGVDRIVANVLRAARPGAIVLMHDGNECHGGDRSETVRALDRIVPALQAQGYSLVTVPDLLGLPEWRPCP